MVNNIYQELFQRYPQNPILTARDWPYPVNSVFNAAAAKVKGKVLLLARVEDMRGISHLTAARSSDGIRDWEIDAQPTFLPDPENYPEEIWGVEDPRITCLEEQDLWAISYTAYSWSGPLVSLSTTKDFRTFERLGPIMLPENKDAALFPIRFQGRWAMLHRPVPASAGIGAHIWISFSPDLRHWGDHRLLIRARQGGWWDANKIGLSPPPLATPDGWLILYHGVRQTVGGCIYRLGLALLDLNNPAKVIRRSDEWIFSPREHYEREGDVEDVVFPCGWVLEDTGRIKLYYGGADTCIALATGQLDDILEYLKKCPQPAQI